MHMVNGWCLLYCWRPWFVCFTLFLVSNVAKSEGTILLKQDSDVLLRSILDFNYFLIEEILKL